MQDHNVGGRETGPELVEQAPRARVGVGHEVDNQPAPGVKALDPFQRGPDGSRVMPVVVHEEDAPGLPDDLTPSHAAAEGRQRDRRRCHVHIRVRTFLLPEQAAQGQGTGRVEDSVRPRDPQAEALPPAGKGKPAAAFRQALIHDAKIPARAAAVGNAPQVVPSREDALRHGGGPGSSAQETSCPPCGRSAPYSSNAL